MSILLNYSSLKTAFSRKIKDHLLKIGFLEDGLLRVFFSIFFANDQSIFNLYFKSTPACIVQHPKTNCRTKSKQHSLTSLPFISIRNSYGGAPRRHHLLRKSKFKTESNPLTP
ncbi:hypothetical protein AAEY33_14220 [Peribacillus simplex]|uniref:hypothetical protein n=1 Tax=Peribacillus simplex TaxID=1478 RepID=UPI0032642D7B